MLVALFLVLLVVLVQAAFVGWSVAIGLLIHRIVPGVDVGIGVLIGVVSTAIIAYAVVRVFGVATAEEQGSRAEEEEGPPAVVIPLPSGGSWAPSRRQPRRRPKGK